MICYKKILILFFSFISFASANVEVLEKLNKVLPLEEKLINNNQIYRVKIQSDLSEEELKALENKKINDVMFVMKYNEDRTFRIFVTDPPKKDKKEKEEFDVVFDRSSFDYRPTNKDQNQDFITFDDNYNILDDISKMKIIGIYILSFILATLLLALIVFFTLKILKEKKRKRQIRLKAESFISLIEDSKNREDFEEIYSLKEDIKKYVDVDEISFNKLLNAINNIQFKRQWNSEELENLMELKRKNSDLRVMSGI